MPVKTTLPEDGSTSQMLQLESAILSKTRGQAYYTKLQDWLISQQTDDAEPQKCSVEMMKKIITVLQGELQCQQFQQARVIVLAIQHVTKFIDFPSGLPLLLSSGLAEILVYAFQITQTCISKGDHSSEKENRADLLMQTILETANDIADYSPEAKQLTVKRFTDKLIDLIVDHRKVFQLRMEAQRTLNLLLENCPGHLTQSLVESDVIKKLMQKLAEALPTLGDFEMQVACTEALARLVTKSKRAAFAAEWFPEKKFASAFLAIQDLNFETDCRKFLNFVNETCGGKKSVHSIPCQAAFLGGFRLLQPPDENLLDFWVDFNSASKSVTMYVGENSENGLEDDEECSMWETVTIKANMVKSYSLTKQASTQKLQLELRTSACDILHFCPSQNKSATISFGSNIDLSGALASSLGEEKCMPSQQTQKKTSISKVNVRVNRADFTSTGLINGHASNGNVMRNGSHQPEAVQRNHHNPVVSTPVRPKVSVPIVPMRTPTLTTYRSSPSVASTMSSSGYNSLGSKRNSNSHQPKTPTRQSSSGTKKVKTPLQIVVADKHPARSTSDEGDADNIPRSAKKVSSTTAAISINSRQNRKIDEKVIQSTAENLNKDNEKEKGASSVSKSVEEPKPSKGGSKKATGSSKAQESKVSKDDQKVSNKPDDKSVVPEVDDDSDSQTTGRRTRGGKRKKKPASSSQESQEGSDNKGSRQTRSSKKFKLYSADSTMLLPDSQSSQETGRRRSKRGKKGHEEEKEEEQREITSVGNTDEKEPVAKTKTKAKEKKGGQRKKTTPDSSQDLEEDLVIPSSMPGTQDSSDRDIIPPSFCPIPVPDDLIATARRRIEQIEVYTNTSICQSPSLSTITEESTQSRKTSSTMSTGTNEGQTVTQRSKGHTNNPLSPVNEEFNMKKNGNARTRSKKSPPKDETAVESKQNLIPQLDNREPDGHKETGRHANKSLTNQSTKPMGKEANHRDPFLFTDTESVKSLEIMSTQNTAKQQTGRKKNNKQGSGRVSDGGKGRGGEMSTQSFSPELSQESPYLSQNDFRSPLELSGVKTKQGRGKAKGRKTTKPHGRGKENGQSNNRQDDDSLSDVEIMRDANASMPAVKDNYATGSPRDDDAYHGEEIYKLSGNIAAKLLQNKAELENILTSSDKKLKQKKAELEKLSELVIEKDTSAIKEKGTRSKRSSANSNETSSEKATRSKSSTSGNNKEVDKSKKHLKSTNAFSSLAKPKFDPALLKFPTRVGPIPTPDAFEEGSKKMKKKSTSKPSTTKPFSWDGSEEEECNIGTEEFQPTGRNIERSSSTLTQRQDQLDEDQIENNLTDDSDNEGIDEDGDYGDQAKTTKQKGGRKQKMVVPENTKSKKGRQKQGKANQERDEDIDSQDSTKQKEEVVGSRGKPTRGANKASDDDYVEEGSNDEEAHQIEDEATRRKKTKHVAKQKKQKGKKTRGDFTEESENDEMQGRRKPKRGAKKASNNDYMEEGSKSEAHQSEDDATNRKKSKQAAKQKKQKEKKTRGDFTEEFENEEMQGIHHIESKKQSIKSQETNKSTVKQVQEKAMKKLQGYSSEEFDIQDIQDDFQSDDETHSMPAKGKQQKRKSIEQQSTKSARSKQQTKASSSDNRQKKDHKSSRKFSSQIEDAESDENKEQTADEEDDRMTVTSVESFHSLCKKILEKSGDGIGATRSRRHVPRVNYKDPDNSEIDLSESGSSEASSSKASRRNVSKVSRGEIELASPASSKRSSSKSDDSQSIITNRSWLVEKPKQKVSTYSKTKAEQWIGIGAPMNLDTVSAKKRPKPKKTVPKPSKKPKQQLEQSDEEDDVYLYYDSEEDQCISQQKAKRSGRQNNNKKTKKTVSNKRQKKQDNVDEERYNLERKAPPALPKKPKRLRDQSDEEDDVYQYYYREEELSPREERDQASNKKKTASRKRQKKYRQENVEEEFDDLEMMKALAALPKKPKRSRAQADDEDDAYQYQCGEEEQSPRENCDQPSNNKKTKKTDSGKRRKNQQQENVEEEFDDLEMMRSQQLRHNATPLSSALLDYNTPRCDVDVYPLTPASMMHDDDDDNEDVEIQLSQVSLVITPRRAITPTSSKTPKVLSFEEEVASEQDNDDVLLVSGPAKGPRPTKSALKRKYSDMSEESDDGTSMTSDKEKDSQQELELSQGQGMLKPKNLFRTSFTNALQSKRRSLALEEHCDDIVVAEEAEISDGMSSLPSTYDPDSAMLQMTQMMKVIGENIREKIRRKETNAQKMTERTIKTAQKQVSRLWSGQHKARRNAQEEFQDKLLTEIVGLESDLNEMEHSLNKSQVLLQQHQRKVSTTLVNHVKKVHKLEGDYQAEGEALEVQLGQHLVRNVKGLLKQGLIDMQKKMVQDAQHHEIQSMKRSLQFIL